VGLRLLDPRLRCFTKKRAREIEKCANSYIRKGVLFNEIAMPDPLLGRYGGVVIAPRRRNRMVVRYTINGVRVHGPPYSEAEEADMHRRLSNAPRVVVSPPNRPLVSTGATNRHKPETSRSAGRTLLARHRQKICHRRHFGEIQMSEFSYVDYPHEWDGGQNDS
jgi:hypothetical protein